MGGVSTPIVDRGRVVTKIFGKWVRCSRCGDSESSLCGIIPGANSGGQNQRESEIGSEENRKNKCPAQRTRVVLMS